ncbi:MAG: hypothetical protein MJZ65_05765 [Paludibacteraceae bacterium]|nr:hypothetical protein [Paludibacteraceae bacterium]
MKHLLSFIFCLLPFASPIVAEVVVLQSGKSMQGTILLQNEEVVMLRDAEGRRYQLPRAEVTDILPDQQPVTNPQQPTTNNLQSNRVALRIDLSGGATFIPSLSTGGYGAVDLQIGSRNLADKRIFIGGSVGYQFSILHSQLSTLNSFLPLMFVFSMPLMDGRHAPEVGAALGYGFAIKQPQKGGMTAKLDLSWRYQYRATSALLLGVQARFQQAELTTVETIEEQSFTTLTGRNFVSVGLRLAFIF